MIPVVKCASPLGVLICIVQIDHTIQNQDADAGTCRCSNEGRTSENSLSDELRWYEVTHHLCWSSCTQFIMNTSTKSIILASGHANSRTRMDCSSGRLVYVPQMAFKSSFAVTMFDMACAIIRVHTNEDESCITDHDVALWMSFRMKGSLSNAWT